MAKLVFGTNKQTVVPAVVRDLSPAHYVEKKIDANGKLVNGTNIINLNGATDVGNYVLREDYRGVSFPANTSVDLSSLTKISGEYACNGMFYNCRGITSVDLSGLTIVSGSYACATMFNGCTGLTSVDLSGLTTVSGSNACYNMFSGCTGLTSVDLSSLETISSNPCQSMFQNCSSLTSVDLSSLKSINGSGACGSMFNACGNLTSVNLSSLTTIASSGCGGMFASCSNLKTIQLNALNTMPGQISPSYSQVFNNCVRLESVELGGLTASTFASVKNQIQYLFGSGTGMSAPNGCTLHFPSNFDPTNPDKTFDITTLTGYPTFGGSASYIHLAFDLPATE